MTMQLKIEYGSTTLNLQTGGYTLLDGFYPQAATNMEEQVTEHFDLWLQASTATDRNNLVRALNQAFEHARHHPADADGVYVYWAIDEDADLWRARVYDGVAALSTKLDPHWRAGRVKLICSLERDPAWLGPEAQVPVTNSNGSNNTIGLPVYNCNDGRGSAPAKYVNWLAIAGASVAGDLPGPARLEIINLYSSALSQLWIGQSWKNASTLQEIYEGEAGTAPGWFSSVVPQEGSSGGYYRTAASPSAGRDNELMYWDMSSAQLSAWAGHWAHAIVHFPPNNIPNLSSVRFRLAFEWSGLTLAPGSLVSHSTGWSILDLGGLRIPPWLPDQSGLAGVRMKLWAIPVVSAPLQVDYVALMPADGFRYLYTSYVPQNMRVVDDAINGETYADNGDGTGKIGIVTPAGGSAIHLQPGLDQRLYFLANDASGFSWSDIALSVKVFYRPKRLTL